MKDRMKETSKQRDQGKKKQEPKHRNKETQKQIDQAKKKKQKHRNKEAERPYRCFKLKRFA